MLAEYMTVGEIAQIAGVSHAQASAWCKHGVLGLGLNATKVAGRYVVHRDDWDRFWGDYLAKADRRSLKQFGRKEGANNE